MDKLESRGLKALVDCKTASFQLIKNIYMCYLEIKNVAELVQKFLKNGSRTLHFFHQAFFHVSLTIKTTLYS